MKSLARLFSILLHPFLIPTYGALIAMGTSYMVLLGRGALWFVTGCMFLFTCLFPLMALFLLYRWRLVGDMDVVNRKERLLPYLFTLICYVGCIFFFVRWHLPAWLPGFLEGAVIAMLCSIVINRWWKISAHMASIGGLTAMVWVMCLSNLMLPEWQMPVFLSVVLSSGILGSSRIILGRHTIGQVLAGFANGFFWVACSSFVFMF